MVPTRFRLTNDPTVPVYGQLSPDETHPYRQKELVPLLNKRLAPGSDVNPYDLQCVRRAYGIDQKTRPDFVYLGRWPSSAPQYSEEFVDWLAEQAQADREFFEKARARSRAMSNADFRVAG